MRATYSLLVFGWLLPWSHPAQGASFTVTNTNAAGPNSFAQVVADANALAETNTIRFNIPGPGVHTIRLASFVLVTNTVVIDGYSQPGASPNTLVQGDNAVLQVALVGNKLALGAGSQGSVVRGLVLQGLVLDTFSDGSIVQGNFIGVDASGTRALGQGDGLYVNSSFSQLIGGPTPADRNLISGNGTGISLYGAPNPFFTPDPVRIQGNYIGTDKSGAAPLGNTAAGVWVSQPLLVLGGTNSGEGNIIAFNQQQGVLLGGRAEGVFIEGNSIYANGGPGIDQGLAGPVLVNAPPGGNVAQGTAHGDPGAPLRVEIFANATCDPSRYGQGQTLIGATNGVADAQGNLSFTVAVLRPLVAGQFLTATATPLTPAGVTSGFSHCLLAAPPVDLGLSVAGPTGPVPAGSNIVYTVTITNASPQAASDILLTVSLPDGMNFIAASSGCSGADGVITCLTAALAGGSSMTASITAQPQRIGTFTTPFQLLADQPDLNPANNQVLLTNTAVNPAPRTLIVTNTNELGPGSLAEAITKVNRSVGGDTIGFNIPGPGVHTIQAGILDYINVPVTIDGYTQPGAHPNTLVDGDNAVLLIDLGTSPLRLQSDSSIVRGLALGGISISGLSRNVSGVNNIVEGCFIGTDPTGRLLRTNQSDGIYISESMNNRIGGPGPAARNLISGTGFGQSTARAGIVSDSPGTVVQGNYIGTDATGVAPLGNAGAGIVFTTPSRGGGGLIGGTNQGEGNVIAFNGGPGVALINAGSQDSVSGNSIYSNGGIGIDLGIGNDNSESVNDPPFTNQLSVLQNAPVITNVITAANRATIQGFVNGVSNWVYRLEFYASPPPPNAFYWSEGKTFLGFTNAIADAGGRAAFNVSFAVVAGLVSATATDPAGNTSSYFMSGQPNVGCAEVGDLLLGFASSGYVQRRKPSGQPVTRVHTLSGTLTGLRLNPAGTLLISDATSGNISRVGPCGQSLGSLVTDTNRTPGPLAFDAAGNCYVGLTDRATNNVWKFDATGNRVATYTVAVESGGVHAIDLAADQRTLYYSSFGQTIHRFDVATGQQLPAFTTNLVNVAGFRLLADGSLWAVDYPNVVHLDPAGKSLNAYNVPGDNLRAIALDPDGQTWWALGDAFAYHLDFASVTILSRFRPDGRNGANTLAIFGEPAAATGGKPIAPLLAIARSANQIAISWPSDATNFLLQVTPTLGPTAQWQIEPASPVILNGRYTVTNLATGLTKFYRLGQR